METKVFATRTENKQFPFPKNNKVHILGIDMGYSGPKCIHEDGYFIFPNYCQKLAGELFGELGNDDMVYEDLETGTKYCVGNMAYRSITTNTRVDENALFNRNHYLHPSFLVIFRTVLGKALWDKETDGSDVFIQTGLPPAYIVKDSAYLKAACIGRHQFRLSIGKETKSFDITISEEMFHIMYQPMGTYYSTIINNDGNPSKEFKVYKRSNIMVLDGGFGTWDRFMIQNNQLTSKDTDTNLGMLRVFEETRKLLQEELGADISIPEMQQVLRSGKVKVRDFVMMQDREYPIEEYLRKANKKVCAEAFDSIKDFVFDVNRIIMTGGTGAAWCDYFIDRLKSVSGLKVVPGNINAPGMPIVYINARGYYLYRYMLMKNSEK
mgnify:CR=1